MRNKCRIFLAVWLSVLFPLSAFAQSTVNPQVGIGAWHPSSSGGGGAPDQVTVNDDHVLFPNSYQITAGTNVTLTPASGSPNTITISASGGSASAGGTNGQIQYNASGALGGFTMSGDATTNTSTGAITIAPNAVTLAKMATIANTTVLGNVSGGTAVPVALTPTQLATIPNLATASLQGMLPALTDAQIVVGKTASNVQAVTMSGGATISDTGAVTLGNPGASTLGGIESYAAVTNQWINAISTSGVPSSTQPAFSNLSGSATLAQFPTEANNTVLGNIGGSTAVPVALTATQLTTIPNVFTSSLQGMVPASSGGTTNFLRADGSWAAPSGGGSVSLTAGNTGIVLSPTTITGTGTISLGNPSASTLGGIESLAAVTSKWINTISTSGVPSATQPAFTDISGSATTAQLPSNQIIRSFGITLDGGSTQPTTGSKGFITIPFAGTITNWYLAADQSGSCVIDVKNAGASIVGSGNKPTLSSAQTGNAAVSGWTSTAITAGEIIEFNLASVSTLLRVNLVIQMNAN